MPAAARRIYVDFDDVLCATARGFLAVLEERFGKTVRFEEVVDFDLGRSLGLAPDELERFFGYVHQDEVLAGFEPLEGAFDTLAAWKALGYEIEVVTGRPVATSEASRDWLAAHRVEYDELIFVEKYDHARGGVPLEDIVQRDYSWVVEDSFDMAERLAGGGHRVMLLDRPWNRLEASDGLAIERYADWNEVRSSIEA